MQLTGLTCFGNYHREAVRSKQSPPSTMPLVDYASSSDDDETPPSPASAPAPPLPAPTLPNRNFSAPSRHSSYNISDLSPLPPPSLERLPDASVLLASPSMSSHQIIGSDHDSRVAAAMAESASRKRESNGSASTHPRSKYPRGRLPNLRNVPDTAGGLLIPPQLSGRSNVATEDIAKLFSQRSSESSR